MRGPIDCDSWAYRAAVQAPEIRAQSAAVALRESSFAYAVVSSRRARSSMVAYQDLTIDLGQSD
jgi:hypothetical protein